MIRSFKYTGVIKPTKHTSVSSKGSLQTTGLMQHDNFLPASSNSSLEVTGSGIIGNLISISSNLIVRADGFARPKIKFDRKTLKSVLVYHNNPIDIVFHNSKRFRFAFGRSFGSHPTSASPTTGFLLGHQMMPNSLIQYKLLTPAVLTASGYIKTPSTADGTVSFILEQHNFTKSDKDIEIASDRLAYLRPVALRHGLMPWSVTFNLSASKTSISCNYSMVVDGVFYSGSGMASTKDSILQCSLSSGFEGLIRGRDGVEVVMTQLEFN